MDGDIIKHEYKISISDKSEYGISNFISVLTMDNKYVGNLDDVALLFKNGIYDIQTINNKNKICSIGFNDEEQKWYGWSHRAMYGFGIGHVVKKGNLEASTGFTEEYIEKHPEESLAVPIGFVCKSLDDCKRCAIAFADSVS